MNIVSGTVLYIFIWFLTLFVVLPIRLQSQADTGEVAPGTPRSAPANPQMKKRIVITTIAATTIFLIVAYIITSGMISIRDIDWLHPR